MLQTYSGIKLAACIFLLLLLLSACGSTDTTTTTDSNAPNKLITVTTRQGSSSTPPVVVTAKSVGGSSQGSSGSGPVVVVSPTPIPGDHTNSQQVVLKDRTLVIGSVSKQNGVNVASSLITLALTVKNTSSKTIMNQPTFFQLMGAEGDTFSYQTNSSDSFYGNVTANSSRSGTIVFQIPGAAAHHLRLLYRPEVAAETTLVLLNV